MEAPCLHINVQSGAVHLCAVSLKNFSRKDVGQAPGLACQIVPGQPNAGLGPLTGKIDHDEVFLLPFSPHPGNHVEKTLIVRPSAPLAETPLPFVEDLSGNSLEKRTVEGLEARIDRLGRTPVEENRNPDLSPFGAIPLATEGEGMGVPVLLRRRWITRV